jgi:hypothetical protein
MSTGVGERAGTTLTTILGVARGSRNSARIAALRATLQRRRVRPPVLPSAMLRFSAIGTADIRRSPRREISVDQRAAARRGTERRSLPLSAMLRFSAIGTADIRRSPKREISVDQRAAARRGPDRQSDRATDRPMERLCCATIKVRTPRQSG